MRFAGDLESFEELIELLDLGSDVVAQAKALHNEALELRDKDAQLQEEQERLLATYEDLVSVAKTLGPQICSHNSEVERYTSECIGRELPEPEFNRCSSWQGQLNARQAVLESQRLAYEERRVNADATFQRLANEQQALAVRVQGLNDKNKAFAEVATDAARRRKPTRGYEIDASSFIQLADKEAGWEKVQNLLLANRGRVFICERAESEVLLAPLPTAQIQARKALMQQWNIQKAEADVPVLLVEFFANRGVDGKDAEIAASAWRHFRTLITGNPHDFAPAVFPNFPFLFIEITKGRLAPLLRRQTRSRVSQLRLGWENTPFAL